MESYAGVPNGWAAWEEKQMKGLELGRKLSCGRGGWAQSDPKPASRKAGSAC